jgi:hypothetical protein
MSVIVFEVGRRRSPRVEMLRWGIRMIVNSQMVKIPEKNIDRKNPLSTILRIV